MHTRLCTYSQMHLALQTGRNSIVLSSLSFHTSHSKIHTHTHTPSIQCKGLSSVLSVPTLCWVNSSFSRGVCGLGHLTISEAACRVETRLWRSPWRSGSWGPIHLQSCSYHMDIFKISKHRHTFKAEQKCIKPGVMHGIARRRTQLATRTHVLSK